jgi:PAS domain S-box-containing protein
LSETPWELSRFGIGRLFWTVSEGIIVGDLAEEKVLLWNPAAEEIFGWTAEEAVGMPLHILVPPELRDAHINGVARYREKGEGFLVGSTQGAELPAIRKDGIRIYIELTLSRLESEDRPSGDPHILALVRDVTDRHRAEELRLKLRDADARKKQAFHLNDSVVQQLAMAKLALEIGDHTRAQEALTAGLRTAKAIISDAMGDDPLAHHSDDEGVDAPDGDR